MKVCLTEAMSPRRARVHDDAIPIYENDDGNSASERGRNDTDMVVLKKELSFIIERD